MIRIWSVTGLALFFGLMPVNANSVAQSLGGIDQSAGGGVQANQESDEGNLPPGCWPGPDAAIAETGGHYWLGAGDRVRLTVFQMPEVSGEFLIRDDGQISIPLFGEFVAEGKSISQIERELNSIGLNISGRNLNLALEVSQHRPVYALGHIVRPGAVPYQPRMTVLKLVAMSGGLFRLAPGRDPTVDVTREVARLGLANEERKQNLARLARLKAQSENQDQLNAPEGLLRIENPERAAQIMDGERRVLEQEKLRLETEIKARDAAIVLAEEAITAMEARQERTNAQVQLAQEEAKRAEDLVQRGLGRRGDLFTIQRIVAGLEADDRDLTARIANAKAALVTAKRERDSLEINRNLAVQEEINNVEANLASNELVVRYSRRIVEDLTNIPLESEFNDPLKSMVIEVVRETKTGIRSFVAHSNTRLCPEDVVKINPPGEQ